VTGFSRVGRTDRPLAVLVSGAPGSGKTTLAGLLADALRMPVISKDRLRQGTMWTLGIDDIDDAPLGPPLFYGVIEAHLALGISVIADMTLYRGLSEPDIAARLAPAADIVNVHCRTLHAVERFESRTRADPVYRELVDRLMPEVRQLQEALFEPLDLTCPCVVVDTSQGYRPDVPEVVAAIAEHSRHWSTPA
jgi:predicted kinase